ncbi:MAG: peptidase [Candidatus Hecatellales archaeon]|nr:MAG: peptidase [Candidatus Hecatellales archaeon]
MEKLRGVGFPAEVLEGLLAYARHMHPREILLLLRGKISEGILWIKEFLIPPFAVHSEGFSSFSPWFLPLDPSIAGTVHSHPSGSLKPSVEDLNHFYGRVMVIVAHPYHSESDTAAYSKDGRRLPVITK